MSITKNSSVETRKLYILEKLKKNGQVTVKNLAQEFDISEVRIRTDLSEMEKDGLLKKVYGGAVSTKKAYYSMSLIDRMEVNKAEKIKIAKTMADLIYDGDTIMIDSGTTTCYVARELISKSNLTILTNSIQIAREFVCNNANNVILLGGQLDLQYQFTYGIDTINQLQKYRADKMILATDGVSANNGLTTYHYQEAEVCRQMIKCSNEVFTVADYSKIGIQGFAYIDKLSSVNVLITNLNEKNTISINTIKKEGINVIEV